MSDQFIEDDPLYNVEQMPQIMGSYMPSVQCSDYVMEFVRNFFPAFDAASRSKLSLTMDAMLRFYAENAKFSVSFVTKDTKGIMRDDSRNSFVGQDAIRQALVNHVSSPTTHDFEKATYDVSYVENSSPAWICLSCNGIVKREDSANEEMFMRTFILSKPADKNHLVIWTDLATFLSQEPTHVPRTDLFPSKFAIMDEDLMEQEEEEDFTSDLPVPKKKLKLVKPAKFTISDPTDTDSYGPPANVMEEDDTLINGKHPTMYLLELCSKQGWPNGDIQFEQEANGGQGNDSWYQFVVKIRERTFPAGQGRNKKDARKNAARMALEVLIPEFGDNVAVTKRKRARPITDTDEDLGFFGSDYADDSAASASSRGFDSSPSKLVPGQVVAHVQSKSAIEKALEEEKKDEEYWDGLVSDKTKEIISEAQKHPISIINEYLQQNKLPKFEFDDLVEAGPDHPGRKAAFWVRVLMQDRQQEKAYPSGGGKSKKQARTRAAALALNELVKIGKVNRTTQRSLVPRPVKQATIPKGTVFGDISSEIHTLFNTFCKENPVYADSGKIIAGIVMRDERNKEAFILSLATGNRCIRGDKLSTDGRVLNDCHAEVLARRGFVRFLYSQIQDFLEQKPATIFELSENKMLKVRQRFSFHLYINTAPCGDGRVFTLSEPDEATKFNPPDVSVHRPHFVDPKKHGVLRTKIEKGEGTIPVMDYSDIQTMDGIGSGERLRTMSCSDKILKWNVLGLQGGLLTRFMAPVYLSTLTIGTLSHHGHLTRAVCCRAGDLRDLPQGYFPNHPLLGLGEFGSDSRSIAKSTPMSISWTYSDQSVEQIDGTHGSLMTSPDYSRLCKREMFKQFKITASMCGEKYSDHLYYNQAKAESKEYQAAKGSFYNFCAKVGYGTWLGKPKEEKCFR